MEGPILVLDLKGQAAFPGRGPRTGKAGSPGEPSRQELGGKGLTEPRNTQDNLVVMGPSPAPGPTRLGSMCEGRCSGALSI